MVTVFAILLFVHGVIHLLGAAKAFGWAELPQLAQPISPPLGALWFVSALLLLATAVSLYVWPRGCSFFVRMHGRIRNGRKDRWMSLAAEQYNVVAPHPRACSTSTPPDCPRSLHGREPVGHGNRHPVKPAPN